MAIDLCELGQVWVSAFPCTKWDYNYPACKILVRSRDSIQVPRKAFGMEDKLLNETILMMVNTGGIGYDDDYTNQDVGSDFVVYIF